MPASTVTRKGQTTLPREVREALGVRPGDRIVYEIEEGAVRIRSVNAIIDALRGAFARPELGPQDLDEAREQFQEYVARHVVESMEP